MEKPTDPYSDDTGAAFYRLPAGMRRAKRNQQREEAGRYLRKHTRTSIIDSLLVLVVNRLLHYFNVFLTE